MFHRRGSREKKAVARSDENLVRKRKISLRLPRWARACMHRLEIWSSRHPLMSFLCARITTMCVLLFFLGLTIFALLDLTPGNIVENYARLQMFAQRGNVSSTEKNEVFQEEAIAEAMRELGLDLPFYKQYFNWLYKVFVKRDLGTSLVSRTPILFLIRQRMINSFILSFLSLINLTIVAFALSIFLTRLSNTKWDGVILSVTSILRAMPLLLVYVLLQLFAATTGWFPVVAYPSSNFLDHPIIFSFSYVHHVFLPLLGAFLVGIGGTLRYVRAMLLDQMGQPYITVLRSRGLREGRIRFAHAFRNTLNPYITGSATLLANLFSGSLILEIVFDYPGIGTMMFEAIQQEDINLAVSNMMFISILSLVGMIISDILLALIDPRIRYGNK